MKKITLSIAIIFITLNIFGQTPASIIAQVKKAQEQLKWVSYTMTRTDTLLTGNVRTMSGAVTMQPGSSNSVPIFSAKLDGDNTWKVFDGHTAYTINQDKKTYHVTTSASGIDHFTSGGGGWLVLPDLLKIDTAKAINLTLAQDNQSYYLTINYDDYKPEDIIKRRKILVISKKNFLPIAMRSHQEALGKVQDLYYHIDQLYVNDTRHSYDFSMPFLKDYKLEVDKQAPLPPVFSLTGKPAPDFILNSFNNSQTSLSDYKGKVVLLDLWEVWCGPCMESMPKVQHLYDTYKDKGLQVFGIINDLTQLESAKQLVKKRGFNFTMLAGNVSFKKAFKLDGIVPLYILINKAGKVDFVGGSDAIESAISKALLD